MDNIKYKLAIISKDKIQNYGNASPNSYHFVYLQEYIKENYSNHPVLKKFINSTSADTMIKALVYFENIALLLNETRYTQDGSAKYGTFACLVLPNQIDEELEQQLYSLENHLDIFNQVVFERVFVDNGILDEEMLDIDSTLSKKQQLDSAIEIVKSYNKNKSK